LRPSALLAFSVLVFVSVLASPYPLFVFFFGFFFGFGCFGVLL